MGKNEQAEIKSSTEKKPTILGRRRFVQMMAALAGAVALAPLVGEQPASAQSPSENPTPSPTKVEVSIVDSRVEAETTPVVVEKWYGDIVVSLDADDIPLQYRQGEMTYVFTDEERAYFRQKKELAIERSEPEVVYQRLIEYNDILSGSSEAHALVTEAPSDIIDDEKLRELGITIVNNSEDKGSPQLHLRESALEGILEPLVHFNTNEQSKSRLDIVPIPGASISSVHLPEGDRHLVETTVIDFNNKTYTAFLADVAKNVEERLAELRAEIKNSSSAQQAALKNEMLSYKISGLLYKGCLPHDLLVDEVVLAHSSANGKFVTAYQDTEQTYRGKTSQIFFANPTAKQLSKSEILSFCFTDAGSFDLVSKLYSPLGFHNSRADVAKSFPSPDDFPSREPGGNYLYRAKGLGWVILHELAHFITIVVLPQMIKEGTIGQSKLYTEQIATNPEIKDLLNELVLSMETAYEERDHERQRTVKEHLADLLAKSYFEKAHTLYEETGDDSLYCFALKVPASNGNPAGWQITNTPKTAA